MTISTKLISFNVITSFNSFEIQAFGIDNDGKTYSFQIKNMKPFFYVKIGNNWNDDDCDEFIDDIINTLTEQKIIYNKKNGVKKHGHIPYWMEQEGITPDVNDNEEELKEYMDDWFDKNVDFSLINKRKLYGFDNKQQYQFIKFEFTSMAAFYKLKNLWYITKEDKLKNKTKTQIKYNFKDTDIDIYEAEIPPLLRLFHIRDIAPCGWVSVDEKNIKQRYGNSKKTYCDVEGIINMEHIYPDKKKEDNAPYKICSFDIEASSSHGDFPLPKKDYTKVMNEIIDFWNVQDFDEYTRKDQEAQFLHLLSDAFTGEQKTHMSKIYTKTKKINVEEIKAKIIACMNMLITDAKGALNTEYMKISEFYKGSEIEDNSTKEMEYGKRYSTYIKKGTKIIDILNNKKMLKDEKIENMCKVCNTNTLYSIEGDKTTFIGSTFWISGEKEQYLNNCIVLGKSTEIPNTEILCAETEKELLLKWRDLIVREDPDIIIGYNIFGFDYSFICDRAEELGCKEEFLKLSRIKDEICEIKENTLQIASGSHTLRFIEMNGRVSIDLYNYFRREFNSLESYKLDFVSGHFIGDTIKDYENNNGTCKLTSKNLSGLHIGNFINFQEIGHSIDYYEGGKKYIVKDIDHNKKEVIIGCELQLNKKKMMKWCLAKDDVTPQDIFRLTETGDPDDKAIIAKYCIQDCNLVHYLLNKIDIITGLTEMANICSVPMSFLVMRGQGIKLYSFLSKRCREMGVLMPDMDKVRGNEGFEGAVVLPPKCGLYLNEPVAVVDYSSLYPSSIISENLSHDSKVWTKEYDLLDNLKKETGNQEYDNLPGFKYIDVKVDTYRYLKNENGKDKKTHVGYKICRFAQFPDGELAIIPSILKELLSARKATRKKAKFKTLTQKSTKQQYIGSLNKNENEHIITTENGVKHIIKNEDVLCVEDTYNDFMKNIFDKRQLSYKITANSTYGQTGAKTSSFYDIDVAAATTKTGQKLLFYAKDIIENVYGDKICETKYGKIHSHAEYIYGDTDSVFMSFKLTALDGTPIIGKEALEHTIELAKEVGQLATKFLKNPHDLEYEKTFMPFCLLSKKRYVGMLYEDDTEKCYRKSMGNVLVRKDNAPIVKDVYGGIVDILMKEQDVNKSIEFIKATLKKIINGEYPDTKYIITKSLRSNYKKPLQIAHKVLADRIGLRDAGNKPKPGDRIPYMYFVRKTKAKLQGDKIETPEFMREKKLQIDYEFYITNQIMKPILQVFSLVLEQIPQYKGKKKTFQLKLRGLRRKFADDQEKYMKKEMELRNKEVTELIFQNILREIKNKKQGMTSLTHFYKN
jgi:DNA polymerase elongation subunit (family B)